MVALSVAHSVDYWAASKDLMMVDERDAKTAVDLAARSVDQKVAWTEETMVVSLVVCLVVG